MKKKITDFAIGAGIIGCISLILAVLYKEKEKKKES